MAAKKSKKSTAKSSKSTATKLPREPRPEPTAVQYQIWGTIYMSLAFLLLVGLTSNHFAGKGNILGPWLGYYLSLGLDYFFGAVAVFIIPPLLFYVGLQVFRGEKLNLKTFIITLAVLLEASVIAYIPALPYILHPDFLETNPGGNLLGYVFVRFVFAPVFGVKVFGPYFILITALLLTIVGFLQIDLRNLVGSFKKWWAAQAEAAKENAEKRAEERETRREEKARVRDERKTLKQEAIKEKKLQNTASEPSIEELAEKMAASAGLDNEETEEPASTGKVVAEPASPFPVEPELGEDPFSPPTITTYEDNESVEASIEEDTLPEGDIGDAAFLEPSLAAGEKGEGDEHLAATSNELVEDIPKQKPYQIPSVDIIPDPPAKSTEIDRLWIEEKSLSLMKTLEEFRLKGCKVVNVNPGPVVTQFEIELAPGIQVKKIVNLQDDIALKVGGKAIRIQAPIPGKAAVGIEIPNDNREIVYYKEILGSPAFKQTKAKLPVIVGKSISGKPLIEDISKMPHVLIAGQTGAGKSVGINSFIASLLFSKSPEELRLIMIDPKKVEMACYEGIPHLMSPVVTEPEKAVAALQWGVKEMEYRYRLLANVGAKNLESFNNKVENGTLDKFVTQGKIEPEENRKLPFVVIIIDELADLMMTASKDVEALVQRIAQLARAVGIHLIVATQRPSVDIITGPIKANLTSRISFRTIQSQDSRTILGSIGAEKLLGMGDMLYLKNGAPTIERYHGAFISEEDVENLVEVIRDQGYETGKIEFHAAKKDDGGGSGNIPSGDGDRDELFEEVARLVMTNGLASTSMVQRRFKIGYNRAGRIMDQMEDAGIVGPSQGGKAREILITKEVLEEILDLM